MTHTYEYDSVSLGVSPIATGKLDWFVLDRASRSSWTIRGSNPGRAKRFLNSTNHPDQFWGLPTFLFEWYWGISHGNGPGMMLAAHFNYVRRLRMSGAIPLTYLLHGAESFLRS